MRDYICEHGKAAEADVRSVAEKYFHSGSSVYAVHTDHFYCGTELHIDEKHLIELRIFDEDSEMKISRLNINSEFSWRYISDTEFRKRIESEEDEFLREFENRVYNEVHYLDIDENYTHGTSYTATGGGKYTLPVENGEKVRIRNYLEYDDDGLLNVADFRIIGFSCKGDR